MKCLLINSFLNKPSSILFSFVFLKYAQHNVQQWTEDWNKSFYFSNKPEEKRVYRRLRLHVVGYKLSRCYMENGEQKKNGIGQCHCYIRWILLEPCIAKWCAWECSLFRYSNGKKIPYNFCWANFFSCWFNSSRLYKGSLFSRAHASMHTNYKVL